MRQRSMIGGYRIVKKIGAGGMSFVYKAVDADGRDVALKLLHPELAADPRSRERLRREVAMLQRVRGKYVARILDAETDEDEIFLVTELIDGPTLDQDVRDSGRYEGADLVELGQELTAALESIHAQGVLHRDLKPSNVMMGEEGPVLIDFGIAQLGDDLRMTQTGALTHTPGFCDPVVVRGAEPDVDADWWALAAVLAFAATGRAPFGVGNSPAVMHRVLVGDADLPGLSPEVERAFRAALAPRREERIGFSRLMSVVGGAMYDDDAAPTFEPPVTAPTFAPPVAPPSYEPAAGGAFGAGDATEEYGGPGSEGTGEDDAAETIVDAGATRTVPLVGAAGYVGAAYSEAERPASSEPLGREPIDATVPLPVAIQPGARYVGGEPMGEGPSLARTSVFERMSTCEPVPAGPTPPADFGGYDGYRTGPLPAWAARPRKARLQVWAASVVVGLFALVWPVTTAVVVAALVVLLSWLGGAHIDLRERRMRAGGPQPNDVMGAVLRSPLTLMGALGRSAVSVGVGVGIGWLTWTFLPLLGALPEASVQAVGVYAGVVVAWFVGTNANGREGVRYLMEGIAPTGGYRFFWFAITLLVALAAGVVVSEAHTPIV